MQIAFITEQTRVSFAIKEGMTLPAFDKFAGEIPNIMLALSCNTMGDGSALEEFIPDLFNRRKLKRVDFNWNGKMYSIIADDFSGLAEMPRFGVTISEDSKIKNEVGSQDEVMHLEFNYENNYYHVRVLEKSIESMQGAKQPELLREDQLTDIRNVIYAELDKMFWNPAVREIKFTTVEPDTVKPKVQSEHPVDYASFSIGDRKWEVRGIKEAEQFSTYISTVVVLSLMLCCNRYNTWFKYRNTLSEAIIPKVNPSLKVQRVLHIVAKKGSNSSKKPGGFSWDEFIAAAIHQVEQNEKRAVSNNDNNTNPPSGGAASPVLATDFFKE